MAKRTPLSAAELDHELADLHPSKTAQLRDLHALLIRATPLADEIPREALARVGNIVGDLPETVADKLPARARTVFVLLAAGAIDAAWAVLCDNATGVVEDGVLAATSSGAARRAWQLPLLTRIEGPTVFADLPGFRDPRYGAPDECYDITRCVRLRHQIDEIRVVGSVVTVGGWAALDPLRSGPHEQLRLIASNGDLAVSAHGRRLRRADLAAGKGEPAERRTWAGWSAEIDLLDRRLVEGDWSLSLEVGHDGVVRQTVLGGGASDLAQAATAAEIRLGSRVVRWKTADERWLICVSPRHSG